MENEIQQPDLPLSVSQDNSSFMSYMPTKESVWNACGTVVNSVGAIYENAVLPTANSFYTTVSISSSDDSAFIKLGYPLTDKNAQAEMHKILKNYMDYYSFKQRLSGIKADYKNDIVRQQYDSLHQFILRRKNFIERAAHSLLARLDGVRLAKHCLTYHDYEPVMSAPIKNIISLFIKSQIKAQAEATLIFSKPLAQLIELNKSQKIETKDEGKGSSKK